MPPSMPIETAIRPRASPRDSGNKALLEIAPDVVQDLPDLRPIGNEGDQAHRPTALRAQQWKNFVDAGDQHCPQVMCLRPFGWCWIGRGWHRKPQRHHPRRTLARGGWLGLHHDLLGRCSQRRHRSPERRVRGQNTKIAVRMGARWWHQGGNTVSKRSRAARSCASMQTPASTEKPLCW